MRERLRWALDQWRNRPFVVDLLLGAIPAVFGLAIPGGRVGDAVDPELQAIFIATLPWTGSVALGAWLWIAGASYQPVTLAGVIAILALGALVAPTFQPEFADAAQHAGQAPHALLGDQKEAIEQILGDAMRQDERVAVVVGVVALVWYVVAAYWVLYGPALWLAGIVCGIYLGHRLSITWRRG